MKIILPDQTVRVIEAGALSVDRILRDLDVSPNEVIVVRDGTLVPDDALLEPDDEIRVIRISHGG